MTARCSKVATYRATCSRATLAASTSAWSQRCNATVRLCPRLSTHAPSEVGLGMLSTWIAGSLPTKRKKRPKEKAWRELCRTCRELRQAVNPQGKLGVSHEPQLGRRLRRLRVVRRRRWGKRRRRRRLLRPQPQLRRLLCRLRVVRPRRRGQRRQWRRLLRPLVPCTVSGRKPLEPTGAQRAKTRKLAGMWGAC